MNSFTTHVIDTVKRARISLSSIAEKRRKTFVARLLPYVNSAAIS